MRALVAIGALPLAVAAYWLVERWPGRSEAAPVPLLLKNTLWSRPQALSAFALVDQHGRAFGRERLRGRWTFLFFGYAACPDICPATLGVMKAVAARLREEARDSDAQFVFVSVDPQRDGTDQLRSYLRHFDPAFIGLTGPSGELAAFARQLNVSYERVPATGDPYQMRHTSAVMLTDPRARLYAVFSDPLAAETMVAKFRLLRRRYEEQAG